MRPAVLCAILVTAAAIAGCGGSDRKIDSKADFIAAGDRICVTAIGDVVDRDAREYGFMNCGQQERPNPVA